MSITAHTPLQGFLFLAVLSSLTCVTYAIPFSVENDVIHAIQPSCTTLSGGSTSCNVGVNTVPSLVSLDGGYQYLTIQEATITESGSTIKSNEPVWTAVQTSYLDVIPVTTTAISGVTTVSSYTRYMSFITTTTTPAGGAPTAVIVAAVIAPAVLIILQPVADNAAGKTTEEIGSEIISAMSESGRTITAGDAATLASIVRSFVQVAGVGVSVAVLKAYLDQLDTPADEPPITSIMVSSAPTTTTSATESTIRSSSSTTSSSSSVSEVTAIVDTPYTDYMDFQQYIMVATGPTPTRDDFTSSTSMLPPATASCDPSNVGAAVEVVGALAKNFCTGLDLSGSSTSILAGSSSGLQGADSTFVLFTFSKMANTCSLGCNASYAQIVKSCEFNSHNIYGQGSLQDSCGTFAMSISSAAPASSTTTTPPPSTPTPSPSPTPTLSAPVLQDQQCYVADSLGRHYDIDGKVQSSWATDFCNANVQTFSSTTSPIKWNAATIIYRDGVAPYHYTVEWVAGCMTTATQQTVGQPLGPSSAVTCYTLMTENWKHCNNKGTGGTRIAGCLKYNFAATVDKDQI